MIFMGYESGSKAYKFYDPKSRKLHVSHDAIFDEEAQWNWVDLEPEVNRDSKYIIFYQTDDDDDTGAQSDENVESPHSNTTPQNDSSPQAGALSPMMRGSPRSAKSIAITTTSVSSSTANNEASSSC